MSVVTPKVMVVRGHSARQDTTTSRKGGKCVRINPKRTHFLAVFNPNRHDYRTQVRLDNELIFDEVIPARTTVMLPTPLPCDRRDLLTVRATFRSPMGNQLPGNPCVKLIVGHTTTLGRKGYSKATNKAKLIQQRNARLQLQPHTIYPLDFLDAMIAREIPKPEPDLSWGPCDDYRLGTCVEDREQDEIRREAICAVASIMFSDGLRTSYEAYFAEDPDIALAPSIKALEFPLL